MNDQSILTYRVYNFVNKWLDCGKENKNDLHCHFKLFVDKCSLNGQILKE